MIISFDSWLPLAEIITAVAAFVTAVIAIAAFFIAVKQLSELKRERKQAAYYNKLSLLPAIVTLKENYNAAERLGLGMRNLGSAVAIVTDITVSCNGASQSIVDEENWVDKLADKLKATTSAMNVGATNDTVEPWVRNVGTATISKGTPFGVGQEFWVLYMITKGRIPEEVTRFQSVLKTFRLRVCYESVYGDKFDTDKSYSVPVEN